MKGGWHVRFAFAPVIGLLAGGCSSGVPGVTHSREVYSVMEIRGPVWNPDSTRLAYALGQSQFRRAIGLNAFPDGGVSWTVRAEIEVYVYDLVTGSGPRKVASQPLQSVWLVGWEKEGILLSFGQRPPHRRVLVDPEGAGVRVLSEVEGNQLLPRFQRPQATVWPYNWHNIRRVDFLGRQAWLWDPVTHTRILLFDLPAAPPGTVPVDGSVPGQSPRRASNRRAPTTSSTGSPHRSHIQAGRRKRSSSMCSPRGASTAM